MRPLTFSEDSALIALFFHDMEKPFRRGPVDHAESNSWKAHQAQNNLDWEEIKWLIIDKMKLNYNFSLTGDEVNALKYTHGEGDDHLKDKRVTCPLAAHVHHCDNTSARIYYDDGKGLG